MYWHLCQIAHITGPYRLILTVVSAAIVLYT